LSVFSTFVFEGSRFPFYMQPFPWHSASELACMNAPIESGLSAILPTRNSSEKTRQILVSFSIQSRKEMCKESLLSYFSPFIFSRQFCHLWLLRVSLVAFDLVICGI
jgi:hypothetical protein